MRLLLTLVVVVLAAVAATACDPVDEVGYFADACRDVTSYDDPTCRCIAGELKARHGYDDATPAELVRPMAEEVDEEGTTRFEFKPEPVYRRAERPCAVAFERRESARRLPAIERQLLDEAAREWVQGSRSGDYKALCRRETARFARTYAGGLHRRACAKNEVTTAARFDLTPRDDPPPPPRPVRPDRSLPAGPVAIERADIDDRGRTGSAIVAIGPGRFAIRFRRAAGFWRVDAIAPRP